MREFSRSSEEPTLPGNFTGLAADHFVLLSGVRKVDMKGLAVMQFIDILKVRFLDEDWLILDYILMYWAMLFGSSSLIHPFECDFVFEEVKSFCYGLIFRGIENAREFWLTCLFLAGMRVFECLLFPEFVFKDFTSDVDDGTMGSRITQSWTEYDISESLLNMDWDDFSYRSLLTFFWHLLQFAWLLFAKVSICLAYRFT
jgi:hypothetical protein